MDAKKSRTRRRKQKHVPQRTCVACRTLRPKRELVRVVRTPEGDIAVDETGKRNGRGAYLCQLQACWKKALSTACLDQALRTNLTKDAKTQLREHMTSI